MRQCAIARATQIADGLVASSRLVGIFYFKQNAIGILHLDKSHDRSTKTSACKPRPVASLLFYCKIDEKIEFRRAVLEMIHRTPMGRGHEIPESFSISGFKCFNGLKHPLVFPNDMAGAVFGQIRHLGGFEMRHVDIPQGFDPHPPGGLEALIAAFVVFAADEGVFDAGIDDEESEMRRQGNVFHRLGAAIEENQVIL